MPAAARLQERHGSRRILQARGMNIANGRRAEPYFARAALRSYIDPESIHLPDVRRSMPMNRPVAALSRRSLMTAAAAAGTLAATTHLSRPSRFAPFETPPSATKAAVPEGYRLTEHIKRYYRTTLV
jgi:hypothetical protein